MGRAIRRYSLLVFIFTLLAITAGVLVYFFLPLPKYTGRVVYLVNSNPPHMLNPDVWRDRDPAAYRALQTNTILSRLHVLNVALAEPGVAALPMLTQKSPNDPDPVQFLQSNLKIDFDRGHEHMRVSLEGDDPEELKMIIKAIHNAYMKRVRADEYESRQKKYEALGRLKREQEEKIKATRQLVRNQLSTLGSSDEIAMQIRERSLHNRVGYNEAEMSRLLIRHRDLTQTLKRLESEMNLPVALRTPPSPELVEAYVENDPDVRALSSELAMNSNQLERYKGVIKPDQKPAPYIALEQKKAELEGKLKSLTGVRRQQYAQKIKEEMAKGAAAMIKSIKSQLDLIDEQRQVVNEEIKGIIKEMNAIKDQNARVEDLLTDINNAETIYRNVNKDLVTIQTEMQAASRINEWEPPHVFPGIEGNRRVKYTAMAVVAFLAMGLGIAQWLEIRHRRIQNVDEVTTGLGLQVLGTVPAVPKGGASSRSNWPHLLTEAVNTTRTMLLSGPNSEHTRTLLVTSAMSGEGKTSLTTHLAVSLASAGRRVMLIDADMRRPAVHKVLGLNSKPGLAELLIGTATMDEVTQATKIPGLHLVAAGTWSREAGASLATERFQSVLKEAAIGYDFVLVDSPPILPVADALAIAKNVDGVLMSVMQDLSRYGAVQTACQRLSMVGAKVLGVVVSGVKTSGGYYYYYYDERYSKPAAEAPVTNISVVATEPPAPPSA